MFMLFKEKTSVDDKKDTDTNDHALNHNQFAMFTTTPFTQNVIFSENVSSIPLHLAVTVTFLLVHIPHSMFLAFLFKYMNSFYCLKVILKPKQLGSATPQPNCVYTQVL